MAQESYMYVHSQTVTVEPFNVLKSDKECNV